MYPTLIIRFLYWSNFLILLWFLFNFDTTDWCSIVFALRTKNKIFIFLWAITVRGLPIMEIVFTIHFIYMIILTILLLRILFIFYNRSKDCFSDVFARKNFQIKCPKCRTDIWYYRIYRDHWMRFIPGTKHYYCQKCKSRFIIFFHRSALKMVEKY